MIYAGNILIGKAISELPPITITFFRLLIAFVVLFPLGYRSAWKYRDRFFKYKKPVLVMALSGLALFNTFIYGALQFTTSSNVAILESIIPAITVVLSAFMLKERLKGIQWGGVGLSLIGAIWVVMDGNILKLTVIDWNVGDLIMIGAIITWAVYSVMVKKYMHKFPPYAAIFVMTGISLIALLPIVIIEWSIIGIPAMGDSNFIIGLLYLGIFPSLIALIFYNRAVALLGASQASIFLNFLPVVTMIGAYLWLGEEITVMHVIGAGIVIVGVLLTTQFRVKRRSLENKKRYG
ncbi:EamA family transporter [Halobacillus amylolyticus]|uniref:EamA family transporter n=2 Tax=Halobacillus amylolyticus TaxID=2932259 RepID=A0ABY4H7B1_9BACI|nr:EamA family transporter [Halobacillus amylolyticus]